jgi:hypothetical protein
MLFDMCRHVAAELRWTPAEQSTPAGGSQEAYVRSALLFVSALVIFVTASVPAVSAAPLVPTPRSQLTEVEIAPFGQYEEAPNYISAGIMAVRFEPPFAVPYTISKIRFPSFTRNGVAAVFSSVRLCEYDPTTRVVLWNTPLWSESPYVGSANDWNEIAVDLTVAEPGKVFFVCVEFPAATNPSFPSDYPYLRADSQDMEKGYFGSSFYLRPTQLFPTSARSVNTVVSLVCRLGEGEIAPLAAPTGLRANRIGSELIFSFTPPSNERLDGTHTSARAAARINLLQFVEYNGAKRVWRVFASSDDPKSGRLAIPVYSPGMLDGVYWAVQAVEQGGRRSLLSNVVQFSSSGFSTFGGFDVSAGEFEPNGSIEEAPGNMLLGGWVNPASINPAGDQDYYALWAKPGQLIWVAAGPERLYSLPSTFDLALFLYDEHEHLVASADSSSPMPLTYRVPPGGSAKVDAGLRRFTLQMCDRRGSPLDPDAIPVLPLQPDYSFAVGIIDDPAPAASMQKAAPGISAQTDRGSLGGEGIALQFVLPDGTARSSAAIHIYNVQGRLVRSLIDTQSSSVERTTRWDRRDTSGSLVASGVYYVRLEARSFQATTKIVLLK